MRLDDDEILARLLAGRDGLSRPKKEAILLAVLDDLQLGVVPRPSRGWWGVALAVGVALVLMLLVGRQSVGVPAHDDPFVARGGGGGGPVLTVLCAADRVAGACVGGSALLFEVADADKGSHVALFSFRPDQTVVWYAPADSGARSIAVPQGATALLPLRAHLGAEHPAGRYEVVAVFSPRPLTRAQVEAAFEHARAGRAPGGVRVVTREVVVR